MLWAFIHHGSLFFGIIFYAGPSPDVLKCPFFMRTSLMRKACHNPLVKMVTGTQKTRDR
jgi:hypothetical protein